MRTGAQYLRSLDDGRQIFLDGERIGKVVEHPAFAKPRAHGEAVRYRRRRI